jgi:hypothetical protein
MRLKQVKTYSSETELQMEIDRLAIENYISEHLDTSNNATQQSRLNGDVIEDQEEQQHKQLVATDELILSEENIQIVENDDQKTSGIKSISNRTVDSSRSSTRLR